MALGLQQKLYGACWRLSLSPSGLLAAFQFKPGSNCRLRSLPIRAHYDSLINTWFIYVDRANYNVCPDSYPSSISYHPVKLFAALKLKSGEIAAQKIACNQTGTKVRAASTSTTGYLCEHDRNGLKCNKCHPKLSPKCNKCLTNDSCHDHHEGVKYCHFERRTNNAASSLKVKIEEK